MNSIGLQNGKWLWHLDEFIRSDPDAGCKMVLKLVSELERREWDSQLVFGIHMAMEEAIMNAIKHGNRNDLDKKVQISIGLGRDSFYARVSDEGTGFDPGSVPDPTLEENLEKASGRGVALMRTFMDQVKYSAVGNTVEMVKSKLPG